jgi:hypothetical protein
VCISWNSKKCVFDTVDARCKPEDCVCVCVCVNYRCRPKDCNNSGHKYETRTVQTATNRNGISSSELGRCSHTLKSRIMMNVHYAVDNYKAVSPKVSSFSSTRRVVGKRLG